MRKLAVGVIVTVGLSFGIAQAADRQQEPDFYRVCGSSNIRVPSTAWTAIPATGSICQDRLAIVVNNYSSNLNSFILAVTSTTEPPPILRQGEAEAEPGEEKIFGVAASSSSTRNPLYLWAVSRSTGSEELFEKEFK